MVLPSESPHSGNKALIPDKLGRDVSSLPRPNGFIGQVASVSLIAKQASQGQVISRIIDDWTPAAGRVGNCPGSSLLLLVVEASVCPSLSSCWPEVAAIRGGNLLWPFHRSAKGTSGSDGKLSPPKPDLAHR